MKVLLSFAICLYPDVISLFSLALWGVVGGGGGGDVKNYPF